VLLLLALLCRLLSLGLPWDGAHLGRDVTGRGWGEGRTALKVYQVRPPRHRAAPPPPPPDLAPPSRRQVLMAIDVIVVFFRIAIFRFLQSPQFGVLVRPRPHARGLGLAQEQRTGDCQRDVHACA
jgi:hypothetical protein